MLKSQHLNNNKFYSSFFSSLKFFFERNTKHHHHAFILGNIFRNSKWSDLKLSNIKQFFVKNWLSLLISLLLAIFIVIVLFGKSKSEEYSGTHPTIHTLDKFLCWASNCIQDWSDQILLSVVALRLYVIKLIQTQIQVALNNFYTYFFTGVLRPNQTLPQKVTNSRQPSLNFSKNNNTIKSADYNTGPNLPTPPPNVKPIDPKYLYTDLSYLHWSLLKNLNNVDNVNILKNPINSRIGYSDHRLIPTDYLPFYYFYTAMPLNQTTHTISSSVTNPTHLKNIESKYVQICTTAKIKSSYPKPTLFLNNSFLLPIFKKNLLIFNFNFKNNLDLMKQERWFIRNTLDSASLVTSSNFLTQTKVLLGLNLLNSKLSLQNLWFPTKISSLSFKESAQQIQHLSKSLYPSLLPTSFVNSEKTLQTYTFATNSLKNINFFEISRMWLTKRYSYLNQQNSNLFIGGAATVPPSFATTLPKNTIPSYNNYSNTYNLNLKKNLLLNQYSPKPVNIDQPNAGLSPPTPNFTHKHISIPVTTYPQMRHIPGNFTKITASKLPTPPSLTMYNIPTPSLYFTNVIFNKQALITAKTLYPYIIKMRNLTSPSPFTVQTITESRPSIPHYIDFSKNTYQISMPHNRKYPITMNIGIFDLFFTNNTHFFSTIAASIRLVKPDTLYYVPTYLPLYMVYKSQLTTNFSLYR